MNQLLKLPRTAPNRILAQQVTVTATLQDAGGSDWENATVIAQLVPGFGTPITEYKWNGLDFMKRQTITSTGNQLSIQLPSNDTILPIDSMWSFTISRGPNTPAVVLMLFLDSKNGSTQDISTQFADASESVMPIPSSPVRVIQAPDEATALNESAANPNNIYWWV